MLSNLSGLLLRLAITADTRSGLFQSQDRNLNNFTFISPLWPIQDRMTCAHVRLLGPCFKTGQVDTDLLAIDR